MMMFSSFMLAPSRPRRIRVSSELRLHNSLAQKLDGAVLFLSPPNHWASSIPFGLHSSPPFLLATDGNFKAELDYPSVGAFLFIVLVFGLHKLLVNKVTEATDRRLEALRLLKDSNGDEAATERYEQALGEEERLRTLVPGVRIAGPSDLQNKSATSSAGLFSIEPLKALFAILVLSQIVLLIFLGVYPVLFGN